MPRRSIDPTVMAARSARANALPRGRYFVEALGCGLALLDLFIRSPARLSLGEMSEAVGANRVKTFRLLRTLQESGYITQEAATKKYSLSLKMLDLQEASLVACEVPVIARPFLEELSSIVHESVSMGLLEDKRVRYVVRVASKSLVSINLRVGSLLPAHATAMGKVLLAALSASQVEALYPANQPLEVFTSRTIRTRLQLQNALNTVARTGYALNDEELEEGLRSAAAPVRNNRGEIVAAINVSTAKAQVSRERLRRAIVPPLMRTSHAISHALGYREDTAGHSRPHSKQARCRVVLTKD